MHRLALILVLASACVADSGDEGFSIIHNLAPGKACEVNPGGAFISRGIIDTESINPYLMTPELESRISPGEGASVAQRTVALRGAKVEVKVADGSGATITNGKFTSLFAGSLSPLGTTTASFDGVTPEIIAQLKGQITGTQRVQLLAKITPYGALGGSGDNVDGVPFEYPITVCKGCVVTELGTCPRPMGTTVRNAANGCNVFQDGMVDCCRDTTTNLLVCPATVATAAQ